jgi:uncharacterized protein (UPF0335 family)
MFDLFLPPSDPLIANLTQHSTEITFDKSINGHTTTKLGLSNNGSLCWLNSSFKLLFLMASDNDIYLLKNFILKDPTSTINIIRNIFCDMWELYHYNANNSLIAENKLNNLKNSFIEKLQQLIKTDATHKYGLEEIFKNASSNGKQDANLFLMSIIKILKLDNPQHNIDVNSYITGFFSDPTYTDNSIEICRKVPVGNPVIIHITRDKQYNSISSYLEFHNKEITGIYDWSNKELYEQGINIVKNKNKNIKIPGNLFEEVEADITNLNSFIIYFSLSSLNSRDISWQKSAIINMMFPQTLAHNSINITDVKSSNCKENITILPQVIICFTGSLNNSHYICLTIENDLVFLHNDETVTCISDNNNQQVDATIKDFLLSHSYTPYAVLFQKL